MKFPPSSQRPRQAGFTIVELIVAFLLFSMATAGILLMSRAVAGHRIAAASASQRNAYATFQSEVALQGINPSVVGNPLTGAINEAGSTGTVVSLGSDTSLTVTRDRLAAFEVGAVSQQSNLARSDLGGSAAVDAIDYAVSASGTQATRGAGIGFAVETSGPAAVVNATQLSPPSFTITGDLTGASFPLNNVAALPSNNPPGTVYRYTTDGTTPTVNSLEWDNSNLNWTPATFPAQVTLAAFNTDPQYAPSIAVTAQYSMQLVITYGRADGQADLYGFTLSDLSDPADTGIVLTANVPAYTLPSGQPAYAIFYTLDGSSPTADGASYAGPFAPAQSNFSTSVGNADLTGTATGTASLEYVALSNDPRIYSTQIIGATLDAEAVPLSAPTYVTDNSQPLAPGTNVVLSVSGSNASPRTTVNGGAPTQSSSSDTSFPLN
ncbi:MAG: chitobiase/beta-hexosaminidase C-terminal domain-containing protein [Opitutaceae bacterium]